MSGVARRDSASHEALCWKALEQLTSGQKAVC